MPRGKWIDKKTAQHFTLVHRPQNDPLIHDSEAPAMVLNPTNPPNASKVKKLDDLASELGSSEVEHMRANEGEAANYGVYYDDSEYDYMQHLRDLDSSGGGGGEVVFLEAKNSGPSNQKSKGKAKQSLEDALRQLDVDDAERKKRELLDDDMLPSKNLRHMTYQAQQDVPDSIGGFQPDMDPRLREVLEALEDDEFVDDDEDIFQELAKDGHELDDIQFENENGFGWEDEDDAGWETDDTAKPTNEYQTGNDFADVTEEAPRLVPVVADTASVGKAGEEADTVKNENWLEDFKKFQKHQQAGGSSRQISGAGAAAPSQSDLQSSLMTTTTNGGRRKKRKGALTNASAYSMTSSSLVRTEQLGLLDARFEKFEQREYNADYDEEDDYNDSESGIMPTNDNDDDDDGGASVSNMSRMSTTSSVTGPMRHDFDGILDEFLGTHTMHGKKHLKKGKWKSGTDELDEIRRELGPARIKPRYGGGSQPKISAAASR